MEHLKWTIGKVKITRFEETLSTIPMQYALKVTDAELEPYKRWLWPKYVNSEGLVSSTHSLLVESAGKRIIIDTGFGRRAFEAKFKLTPPQSVPEALEAAGYPINTIDTVLCTHIHGDHIGGHTSLHNGKIVPTYPKASYLFTREDMEYMSDPAHDPSKLMDPFVRPVVAAGLSKLVPMDYKVTPEVRLVPVPGHTPGCVCILISSGGQEALIVNDVLSSPVQVFIHDVPSLWDCDPAMALKSRKLLLEECVKTGRLAITIHFLPPTSGYVRRREDGGYRWEESSG